MARPVIKALFTFIALSWPTCFVLQENSGRNDEQQDDKTTSVVTVQIGMTPMLIKTISMLYRDKTRVTVHFAADKRLCDSPPCVDVKWTRMSEAASSLVAVRTLLS